MSPTGYLKNFDTQRCRIFVRRYSRQYEESATEPDLVERHGPHHPLELKYGLISDASHLWTVSPAVTPSCVDGLTLGATDGLTFDSVTPRDVLATLRTRYSEKIAFLDGPDHELYEVEETPPSAVWIAEIPETQCVGLIGRSETGVRGLIITETDGALEGQVTSTNGIATARHPSRTSPGRRNRLLSPPSR